MRRFDKKTNIAKANILAERRYISERIINESTLLEFEEEGEEEGPSAESIKAADDLSRGADALNPEQNDDTLGLPNEKVFNIDVDIAVPVYQRRNLDKAIEGLKKMARKLKLPEPSISIGQPFKKGYTDEEGHRFAIESVMVSVKAENMFKISDLDLVAIVDNSNGGSIIVGDNKVPTEQLAPSQICDYCKINRARGKSYVVIDKNHQYQRFGSDCVKKVVGINPAKYIAALQFLQNFTMVLDEFDGPSGGGGGGSRGGISPMNRIFDFDIALTLIKQFIDEFGYVKKEWSEIRGDRWSPTVKVRTNKGDAIADKVEHALFDDKLSAVQPNEQFINEFKQFWGDMELTPETAQSGFQQFLLQIKELTADGQFRAKDSGMMVYAVHHFMENKKKAGEPVSTHIGQVGTTVLVPYAELIDWKTFDSHYGTQSLWSFKDENGNLLKKFGVLSSKFRIKEGMGKEVGDGLKIGDVFKFNAEVKKHDVFNGQKSTLLGRLGVAK